MNPIGIEKYLCEDGHKSFLEGKHNDPFIDSTGHGTMMAHAMAETLNPTQHCIVVYKTYPGYSEETATTAYANALIQATNEDFIAIAIAIEDTGHYFAEAGWYRSLTKKSRVFVAAGNGGKSLDVKCDVFPACLASDIKSENFRVVGDTRGYFNHGGPVNEIAKSEFILSGLKHRGTSVSTARVAAAFMRLKILY